MNAPIIIATVMIPVPMRAIKMPVSRVIPVMVFKRQSLLPSRLATFRRSAPFGARLVMVSPLRVSFTSLWHFGRNLMPMFLFG